MSGNTIGMKKVKITVVKSLNRDDR